MAAAALAKTSNRSSIAELLNHQELQDPDLVEFWMFDCDLARDKQPEAPADAGDHSAGQHPAKPSAVQLCPDNEGTASEKVASSRTSLLNDRVVINDKLKHKPSKIAIRAARSSSTVTAGAIHRILGQSRATTTAKQPESEASGITHRQGSGGDIAEASKPQDGSQISATVPSRMHSSVQGPNVGLSHGVYGDLEVTAAHTGNETKRMCPFGNNASSVSVAKRRALFANVQRTEQVADTGGAHGNGTGECRDNNCHAQMSGQTATDDGGRALSEQVASPPSHTPGRIPHSQRDSPLSPPPNICCGTSTARRVHRGDAPACEQRLGCSYCGRASVRASIKC